MGYRKPNQSAAIATTADTFNDVDDTMQTIKTQQSSDSDSIDEWLLGLDKVLDLTDRTAQQKLKVNLNCRMSNNKASLFLPPEMALLQPQTLSYLHSLAASNKITLVEDRRKISVEPPIEQRKQRPSDLAIGVSLLLKQTGLPGPAHSLSEPHVLREDNHRIDVSRLIKMTARLHDRSRKVVFLPNRFLTGNFREDAAPMTGYACKSRCGDRKITLSYFNAPEFRSVGYISGDQFVLHVLLAGGPIQDPKVWCTWDTLTNATFRCQVYQSPVPGHDFGLLYSTFYIDLDNSMEEQSWWGDGLSKLASSASG